MCDLVQTAQARALPDSEDELVCNLGNVKRLGDKLRCTQCAYQTWSKQKLAVHAFSKHGIIDPVRAKLDASGVCYACMVKFGSRLRLREHLFEKGAGICKRYFMEHTSDVDPEVLDKLEGHDREVGSSNVRNGLKRSAGAPDCMRICGPHPRLSQQFPGFRHPLGNGHRWHSPFLEDYDG